MAYSYDSARVSAVIAFREGLGRAGEKGETDQVACGSLMMISFLLSKL